MGRSLRRRVRWLRCSRSLRQHDPGALNRPASAVCGRRRWLGGTGRHRGSGDPPPAPAAGSSPLAGLQRGHCYRRGGVAAHRFQQDRVRFDPDLPHLFGHDEAGSSLQISRSCQGVQAIEPLLGLLQQCGFAVSAHRPVLLGVIARDSARAVSAPQRSQNQRRPKGPRDTSQLSRSSE